MRKYLPTLSELIDRLSIVQLKEVFIPEHKKAYSQEIDDIVHDIDLLLKEGHPLDGNAVRDIIVLAQMNLHIWGNEANYRKGIDDGNHLKLSHGLNGIRNTAKNKIQSKFGGRKDYKIDCIAASFKDWLPSGYEPAESQTKSPDVIECPKGHGLVLETNMFCCTVCGWDAFV